MLARSPLPDIPGIHRRSDGAAVYFEEGETWVLQSILRGTEAMGDCDYRFICESEPAQVSIYSEMAGGVRIYQLTGESAVLHSSIRPAVWTRNGRREWHHWGELHRADGPAVENADDGSFEWWRHGQRHRIGDEPAVSNPTGQAWFVNGEPHREGAPARIDADGIREWWVQGDRHREDGPAIESADGSMEWWLQGERHREDGPAVELADGTRVWVRHGKIHNADGPAQIEPKGRKRYFLEDQELSHAAWLSRTGRMTRANRAGVPGSVSAAMNRR